MFGESGRRESNPRSQLGKPVGDRSLKRVETAAGRSDCIALLVRIHRDPATQTPDGLLARVVNQVAQSVPVDITKVVHWAVLWSAH